MDIPRIFLKERSEKRVLAGHLWVFSNEIDKAEEEVEAGGQVDVYSSREKFIGRGFVNPHSLIAARILTRTQLPVSDGLGSIVAPIPIPPDASLLGLTRHFQAVSFFPSGTCARRIATTPGLSLTFQ